MIKTINAWAFLGDRSTPDIFRMAKENGFQAVELTIEETTGPLTLSATSEKCAEIVAQEREYGVLLSSLASGLGWRYPITADDQAIAQKGVDTILASIELAHRLGVDALLVVPGGVRADFIPNFMNTPYDIAYRNALFALRRVAPVAEELGVTIAVENVWNQFLLSPLEFRDFLDQVGSPRVKAYFDVGNVLLTGSPEQWIRILGDRIARVHFKDFATSVGTLDGFCDLLEGDVDYPGVMAALRSIGYDGYVTAEYFKCEDDLGKISTAMDTILGY